MTSRLAIFCDKLLEVCWLAALIVVPLYFDIYSSRVFEPDKLSLLRSIALVMVGAWIVKQTELKLRFSPARNGNPAPRPPMIESLRASLRENPLLIPTWFMVVVYIISTIFSVTISVSFWGSYQRMQGTYTTFSYIVVFLVAAGSLRTRTQFDRAVNVILATAFPVGLYGIMQHFQVDPLPWAGDVTQRVASNMGNSIFVAAYLIMVLPLAVARWLETVTQWSTQNGDTLRTRIVFVSIAVVMLGLSIGFWLADFTLGAVYTVLLFPVAYLIAPLLNVGPRSTLLVASYTNILGALLMTIFYSQSRGPWIGLASGLFLFIVIYALARRAWLFVFGAFGLGILGFSFLVLFNLPNSPLTPLKSIPYIGRLGSIFDPNEGTGKVRELIWEGDVPLILPHDPLWAPTTGDDVFNAIRPLVGYGPEAMYVVYNRYYPPDLAHYESRNASPDRSHNETFDSLVITGLLGFAAYLLIFTSVVYFGLKWLGVITTSRSRNLFIGIWFAFGFIAAAAFGLLRGWNFAGVALPAGMVAGLFIFLLFLSILVFALRHRASVEQGIDSFRADPFRSLWLSALLAAVIGHFIEINFGIAIASTRLHFWFYAALLVVIGMDRLRQGALAPSPAVIASPRPLVEEPGRVQPRRRKGRRIQEPSRKSSPASRDSDPDSAASVLPWTAIVTLILITLGFEFFTNQSGATSALDALQRSLFTKGGAESYGVFLLIGLTWVNAGILGLNPRSGERAMPIGLFTLLSLTALLWYALLHLRFLTQPGDQTDNLIGVVGLYYVAMFVVIGAAALALLFDESGTVSFDWIRAPLTTLVAPVLIILVTVFVYITNFSGVAADILYKVGQNFDNAGQWDRSIAVYERALQLQPAQDFYALFLGRAYLESSRAMTDSAKRATTLEASQNVLSQARAINPLNTDHSANLARLQRTWASLVDGTDPHSAHLQQSIQYYQDTLRLSPNTAHLHDELGQTYQQAGDPDQALQQFDISLGLDQRYPQTYLYLGDYYRAKGDNSRAADYYLGALAIDPTVLMNPDNTLMEGVASVLTQPSILPRAILSYTEVISVSPESVPAHMSLAGLYKASGQSSLAQRELEQAAKRAPSDYLVALALVNFFSESGRIDDAVTAMRHVVDLATQGHSSDLQRFQDFYTQLQNLQRVTQAAQKSPNDVNAQRTAASMWKARGQPQFALPEYITITRLAPNDYDAQKNVALLSLQQGRLDDAQAALVAATSLAPEGEKGMWQNLQIALNAQKARQFDQALSAAQAALALANAADKPTLQAYVSSLQGLSGIQ